MSNKKAVDGKKKYKTEYIKEDSSNYTVNCETFDLSAAYSLLDEDHILSLASLRIEIEKKIRNFYNFIYGDANKLPLLKIIQTLIEKEILHKEQAKALRQIISMCNKAIHSLEVSYNEAKAILDLAEELNISFPIGYSINLEPNKNYKKAGLICEYEHCIERMPLPTNNDDEDSCPVFGHACPGGDKYIKRCDKTIRKVRT